MDPLNKILNPNLDPNLKTDIINYMITPTIAELRRAGYKVRVIIKRVYKYVRGGSLHKIVTSSKRVLETLTEQEARHGLQNSGGSIKVEVRAPDGREVFGESFCHPNDNFNRRAGRTEALGRALEQLYFND